jgi:asparagine synthase (glutamine-hydrolysing)
MAVLVADQTQHLCAASLHDRSGVVLGAIFTGWGSSGSVSAMERAQFGARETRAVIETRGRILASRYWGNYVAFMQEIGKRTRFVFNDPCGSLPCHFVEVDGVQILFSCVGDCRDLGLRFQVNWAFVRARVICGPREVRQPPFTGVSSIFRGECVGFDREAKVEFRTRYWCPDFAGHIDLCEPEVAQRAMRETVLACTHAMAAGHSEILAQVSGGLDSSIVLGCLGEMAAGPTITCYTYYMPDSVCDERRWARQAVQRLRLAQIEAPSDPAKLNFADLPALSASMEPQSHIAHWQKGPLERNLAIRHGASTIFTGEGGDAAFCSTSYVFAVDHCLRRYGISFRTLRTAKQVAIRRDRTIWNVLGKALARKHYGDSAADVNRTTEPLRRLVLGEVRESTAMNLETSLRLGPQAMATSFYDVSTSHYEAAPYASSPLCAQPVVELCGRVPVDVHFDGGKNRGLARRAFADIVPEPILRRQWKDRPLLQLSEVIALNLRFIREHLLDGILVKERILDRAGVEQALLGGPNSSRAAGSEILGHLDVELWMRDLA